MSFISVEFFIFFPGDWHIAKVANASDDQVIRVIVAKLKYVEQDEQPVCVNAGWLFI